MPLPRTPCSGDAMAAIVSDSTANAGGPMGAVEHLKTLCCLGLPPESAMIAVVPLLHEIIPHGGTRLTLVAPDATITSGYSENPATEALFRERLWQFMDDPSSLMSMWVQGVRAVAIGWTLHRQGGGYLESAHYRELEAPLKPLESFIICRERSKPIGSSAIQSRSSWNSAINSSSMESLTGFMAGTFGFRSFRRLAFAGLGRRPGLRGGGGAGG